jgi:hypothetical protein
MSLQRQASAKGNRHQASADFKRFLTPLPFWLTLAGARVFIDARWHPRITAPLTKNQASSARSCPMHAFNTKLPTIPHDAAPSCPADAFAKDLHPQGGAYYSFFAFPKLRRRIPTVACTTPINRSFCRKAWHSRRIHVGLFSLSWWVASLSPVVSQIALYSIQLCPPSRADGSPTIGSPVTYQQ